MSCDSLWLSVVLLCKFDGADGATTAADVSSYGRTLTFGNSAQLDTGVKRFGTAALQLHGTSGSTDPSEYFVSAADAPELSLGANSAWCVEGWYQKNSADHGQMQLFGKYLNTGNQREFWCFARSGELIFAGLNGTAATFSMGAAHSLDSSSIHHIAVERYLNAVAIYQNGTLLGSKAYTGSMFSGTSPLYIGKIRSAGFGDFPWPGWIDEFRMTVGVARYQGAFTAPSSEFPSSLCVADPGSGPGAAVGGAFWRVYPAHTRRQFPTSAPRKFPRA